MRSLWRPPATPRFNRLLAEAAAEMKSTQAQVAERNYLVAVIQGHAERRQISQRKLAKLLGLPWSTWCKIKAKATVAPAPWLPALRAAAARLQ